MIVSCNVEAFDKYEENEKVSIMEIPMDAHYWTSKTHSLSEKWDYFCKLFNWIPKIMTAIDSHLAKNTQKIVHCRHGWNRSAMIIMIYLMCTFDVSAQTAFDYIGKRRPGSFPCDLPFLMNSTVEKAIRSWGKA